MWKGLLSWGKGIGSRALSAGRGVGSKALSAGGRGLGWYNSLGPTAQNAIMGAGIGGAFGGFDTDSSYFFNGGGFVGGALAGAAGGAAYGRFGAHKNLLGRGVDRLMDIRAFNPSRVNSAKFMKFAAGAERVSMFSNKHGDKVLSGLAAASAGLIGGSILSTNRPY